MDQNDPPQFNHPISASYGFSSGGNLADVLFGGHAPRTKHLSTQTGDFYFGAFGEYSSGSHIYPETSKTTEPFSYRMGCTHRHPIGALGVDEHVECGRIIKAAMASEYTAWGARRRLNSLRAELENWYNFEIKGKDPEGIDFFKVYYGETPEDKALRKSMTSAADVVFALGGVSQMLKSAYPDCAPLRKQLRRLEMAASMIGKAS